MVRASSLRSIVRPGRFNVHSPGKWAYSAEAADEFVGLQRYVGAIASHDFRAGAGTHAAAAFDFNITAFLSQANPTHAGLEATGDACCLGWPRATCVGRRRGH